jgi:hypothetical protein
MRVAPPRQVLCMLLSMLGGAAAFGGERSTTEEFLAVSRSHAALTRYSLQIDVSVGGGAQALQAEVQCAAVDQCVRRVGGVTVLQSPTWTIAVDDARRTLTVSARDPKQSAGASYPDPQKVLAEWLETGAKISGGEVSGEGRRWLLTPPNPRQSAIEVYTDPKSNLLQRIVYGADADAAQRIEILYRWNATQVDESRLDPKRYIRVQGKKVQATGDYANYRVIRVQGG